MIKIIAHCPFSGVHSPKVGVTMRAIKLTAIQEAKEGPNAAVFDGVGACTLDASRLTAAAQAEFEAGAVYEITFRKIELAPPAPAQA